MQSIFRPAARRETLGEQSEGGRRDGGLKMSWTNRCPVRGLWVLIVCRIVVAQDAFISCFGQSFDHPKAERLLTARYPKDAIFIEHAQVDEINGNSSRRVIKPNNIYRVKLDFES
jgi:hypothetical protein